MQKALMLLAGWLLSATMAHADAGGISPFMSTANSLLGSATAVAPRWYEWHNQNRQAPVVISR